VRLQLNLNNRYRFTGVELSALIRIITAAVKIASEKVLKDAELPPTIKKAQAMRMYGRRNVERWLAEGLLKSDQNKIDRQRIAAVARTSNRLSYRKISDTNLPELQPETHE